MSGRQRLGIGAAALALLLLVGCDVLVLLHHAHHWPHSFSYWLVGSIQQPIWSGLAIVLIRRVPGNRMAWLSLGIALSSGVQLFSGALSTQLIGGGPTSAAADWLAAASAVGQMGTVGGLIVFAQLAPDGRPVGPRWRWVTPLTLAGLLAIAVMNVATDAGTRNLVPASHRPVSLPAAVITVLNLVGNLAMLGIAAAVVGLVVRWRRSRAAERQQLKWIVFGGLTAIGLVLLSVPLVAVFPGESEVLGNVFWSIIPLGLPVGTAVAVLRYRLYDIDRLVSRTVTYAAVTAGVAGTYVGAIVIANAFVQLTGVSSSAAVAASTLSAAAAFQPLRRRMQRLVDRRFDRAAYDARRTVEAFTSRLRDEVDVDAVRRELVHTVAAAVAPERVAVWVVAP